VAGKEIQAVEVSCFIHATENDEKVEGSIRVVLDIKSEPTRETLEGHFGNRIVRVVWHLTGDDAWLAFSRLVDLLARDGRAALLRDLAAQTDEHGALYIRLSKQSLIRGDVLLSTSDPVKVRIKPRRFMMRGSTADFYGRILGAM
jgi:RNA binding exosome subunit